MQAFKEMEQFVESFDGTKLYSIYHPGERPLTLVFLHGVGANWTIWKKEIEFFRLKGYPILTQDLRGHGKSEYPAEFRDYSLECFTCDLKVLVDKHKVKNFVFIGHSLGGSISISYCMSYKRPYPKSLVLVESAATYPFDHDRLLNYSPYVTQLARYLSRNADKTRVHFPQLEDVDLSESGIRSRFNLVRSLLHLAPIRAIVETLDNIEEFVHKNQKKVDLTLKNLKIPTLLIAGDCDPTVPVEYSKYIKNLNKAAELRIIKDNHHKVTAEHPREVCQILHRFVKHKLQAVLS